jgi:hypothetical protein
MNAKLPRLFGVVALLSSLLALLPWPAAAAPPSLTTLQPGGFREIAQDLDINLVFVGYRPGAGPRDINEAVFRAGLPRSYRPIDRDASFYSQHYFGRNTYQGLSYNYRYNLAYANAAFEDALFGYLGSIAVPKPLTIYQQYGYNSQRFRSLTITDDAWVDAPSVEKWLADHAGPMLGVDTRRYTVFFLNWYGRPEFRFHVYTKTDEPDPDTGYNCGLVRESRKLIAWGGTTPDDAEDGLGALHRIWFYDLSAGPEGWTANWDLDDADLDGDGKLDYRMPPVWEYGNLSAYRPFNDLSGDLAKVTRYVALDLLFTTSPLYKPALSPPALPSRIELDVNVYQIDPGLDGKRFLKPTVVLGKLGKLQPFNSFSLQLKDVAFTGEAERTYRCWLTSEGPAGFVPGRSCYGNTVQGYAFYDLFLYHWFHLLQFVEGDADYEVPTFIYTAPDNLSARLLLAYAEDNLRDGTQTFINIWNSPTIRALGYGDTGTLIHETGHHLGLSHPHDGYDYERDLDFDPTGSFAFAWSGDESNTVMNYLAVNHDFSQFDRDNMNRWMVSVYLNQANAVLAKVYASPRAGEAGGLLTAADGNAASALAAYDAMDYADAVISAKSAYQGVIAAAAKIGVKVEPEARQADYKAFGKSFKFVDRVDDHMNLP